MKLIEVDSRKFSNFDTFGTYTENKNGFDLKFQNSDYELLPSPPIRFFGFEWGGKKSDF